MDKLLDDPCRKAFEGWLPTQGYLAHIRADGKYDSSHTEIMWLSWREAWHYPHKHSVGPTCGGLHHANTYQAKTPEKP